MALSTTLLGVGHIVSDEVLGARVVAVAGETIGIRYSAPLSLSSCAGPENGDGRIRYALAAL